VLLAFGLQWLAFIPAYLRQTEKFYDLTGSLSYISVVLVALWMSGHTDSRSLLLAALIIIWALRLGSFLFLRILADGSDSRFDKIKPRPISFLATWSLQGLWVSVTAGCALAAITTATLKPLTLLDLIGIVLWVLGFALEVIADRQKRQFRQLHGSGQFIATGLWSRSRHPNYLGEIMLWLGVALLAAPALQGWQWVTVISPLFVYLLLTRVSGIPLLERKSDQKWGDDPQYLAYEAKVPVLVPGFTSKTSAEGGT
jgi:steroid 5-alpha reductase family enzyme